MTRKRKSSRSLCKSGGPLLLIEFGRLICLLSWFKIAAVRLPCSFFWKGLGQGPLWLWAWSRPFLSIRAVRFDLQAARQVHPI